MEGTCRIWVGSAFPAGLEERAFTAGNTEGCHRSRSQSRGVRRLLLIICSQCCPSSPFPSPSKSVHGVYLNRGLPAYAAPCLPTLAHHGDTSIQHPGPGGDLGSRKLGSSRRQLLGPCHLRRCTLRHRRNLLRSPKGAEPIPPVFICSQRRCKCQTYSIVCSPRHLVSAHYVLVREISERGPLKCSWAGKQLKKNLEQKVSRSTCTFLHQFQEQPCPHQPLGQGPSP